jgi:hypothetical protein
MTLRTRELLAQTEHLPADEFSINYAEREFADATTADSFLSDLKRRLVDLSHWNENSGMSSYKLFGSDGRPDNDGGLKPGFFVEITLHGTGKSDWVRVEDIYESPDELVITVKPTYDPTDEPPQTGTISHFFTSDATNNFCALREGTRTMLYVIGLNERLNSGHTSGMIETVRNTAVANIGYYLGIQKAEWKKFCESFFAGIPEPDEK